MQNLLLIKYIIKSKLRVWKKRKKGQKNTALEVSRSKANGNSFLTRKEFHELAAVPAEAEWFANIQNPRTRRAYQGDIQEFMGFVGIHRPEEFRIVNRAHILAWRKDLEERKLAGATIRRKLAALSSLFEHLCEVNAITHNPG